MLQKIKLFFVTLLKKITLASVKDFFKKWGLHIVNILILAFAYDNLDTWATLGTYCIVGLWLFFLLGYYIFWKLLGAEKAFKRDEEG